MYEGFKIYFRTKMDKYLEVEEKLKNEAVPPKLLEDLRKEQTRLGEDFPICTLLIKEAFDRFYSTGLVPGDENFADIFNEKPIKLTQKVLMPSKFMASNGKSMLSLQDETQCEIIVKRRNYLSGHDKDEQLRQSGDPKFKHFSKDLFLEISTFSTPIECYSRIAYALKAIRLNLISNQNDKFESEEFHEMEMDPITIGDPEHVKCEQADQVIEDPLLGLGFKEHILPSSLLNKPQQLENKPLFTSLANKLIKLLDETVFNPHFQYSEEETMMVSNNINILNRFIYSKALSKAVPISTNTSAENISSTISKSAENIPGTILSKSAVKFTHKNCSQNRDRNSGVKQKRLATRKKILESTNKIQLNKEKKISNKKIKMQNGLKFTKEKSPGIFYLKDMENNKIITHLISNKSALSRCLKRYKTESIEQEENDNSKPLTIECFRKTPFELVFEYTPRDVIISFLETMKNYPILWEFHDKPFNDNYNKTIEDMCQAVNGKWLLNIDNLKMRRSINRVLRFYRYLFPFECIDEKFTDYFDKCAVFLPSAVITIPHARCSHCFVCFREDYELKKHLNEEHKSLKWRYKCQYCAESFREINEYEFHKRLPHYMEVFTCEHCNKRLKNRFAYNRHMYTHQREPSKVPRNYICDECGKDFKTSGELRGHKSYHGEKKLKCHLCPKSYFKNTSLMLHLKSHRKELDFICEVCGDGFISQPYLKNHMVKHMGIQITCTICGLKLRKHNLLRHLRTVHVACEGTIEETFRAKGHNYKRHTSKGIYKGIFNPSSKQSKRAKEKFERQYECKTCNIPFDRLKFLKDHNKEVHFNANKVPCKICGAELSHKQNLKRHYREKHKMNDYQFFAITEKNEDIYTVLEMKSESSVKTKLKKQMK